MKWLETPTENMRWCGGSLKKITNLDRKLKVLKNKISSSLSLRGGGEMEEAKFMLYLIAQAQEYLEDSEAGTDLHAFFQSQPLVI